MDKDTKKEFENLGKMIKDGFDENTKQHKKFSDQIEGLDARINKLDRRMDVLVMENSKAHKAIYARIDKVEKNIKKELAKIRRQLKKTITEEEFVKLEERVEALEQKACFT